jgi:AbrB family looped-hinge helix DNA binding protein
MEVALTKMSVNGQVVIPAEVRRDAGVKPHSKFLVFNKGGNILLKPVDTKELSQEMELVERIGRSERQIRRGKVVKADTKMSLRELDDLLTS